jgi:tetratricopeptide (TPR) repeat protein
MKNLLFLAFLILATSVKAQVHNEVKNLIAAERFDDAIDTLESIKKMDPKNQYVYFELGEAVLQSFKSDTFSITKKNAIAKALGYFNEGVQADSLNPLNYVGLGIISLYSGGNTQAADTYFNKALRLIPEKKKKVKDIHITTLIKIATAELYSPNPRIQKSKEYIARLKDLAPKNPDVYLAEGDILLYNAANASDAISSYEKALSLNNNPYTNVRIGRIYMGARMTSDAAKHFEDALKVDSTFAPAYKGFGDLYYKTGKLDLAKNYYARYLRLTGNNIPAKVSYTKALFLAKDYDEALKSAQEVIKIDSSKTYLFRIAAYSALYKAKPDLEAARHNMDKLFSLANRDMLIQQDYLNYGRILLLQHNNDEENQKGVQMLEAAYQQDTTNVELISEILKSAYTYKVYPVAVKYMNIIISRGKNTPNNYLFLGKLYYQMHEYPKADSVLAKATRMDSVNVEAYLWRAYVASARDTSMKLGLATPFFEKIDSLASPDKERYSEELTKAYSYLGGYYLEKGQAADINKAEVYFQKLLALGTSNKNQQISALHSLAYINAKKKNYAKSRDYYQMILQLNPNDETARKGLNFTNKSLKAKANNNG